MTTSAVLIPASAAAIDAVLDLLRGTDAEAGFDPNLISHDNAAFFNAINSPDQGFLFYAQTDGGLVGYGRLERSPFDPSGFGVVALTVLAAHRRKGLGEALLRALLREAGAAGLPQVWLSVRSDNDPALCLYRKLGFVGDVNPPAGGWSVPGELTMVWRADRA